MKLLKNVSPVNPMDDETVFIANENLVTLCGIGLIVVAWLDPNEVVAENVNKLKARYPGGEFDVHYSENRKEGDL